MTEHDRGDGDNPVTGSEVDGREADGRSTGSTVPSGAESDDIDHGVHHEWADAADFPEDDTELTDLSAIQADDALLDALGAADSQVDDGLGDQQLSALLLAWRRDVDSEAMPELVDTQSAVTTVKTAVAARNAGRRGRRRLLVPVAAAAAVLAIGFTGTALAARAAEPGDTLWGLSKVLYSDHARSVEAAASVRTDLDEAHLAIAQERYGDARRALDQAEESLSQLTGNDELDTLRARHTELLGRLDPDQQEQLPPAATSDSSSESKETRPTTPSDTLSESSEHDVPPELDETSSIPTTEPSTPSTEPTTPSTTSEDSPSEEKPESSRSDTSLSRDAPGSSGY